MELKVPEVGESIFEAEIGKWHKKDGETVSKDDLLCELETDKISLEINAEVDGVLHIQAQEGETVKIGAVIGAIEESAGTVTAKPAAKEKAPPEKAEGREGRKAQVRQVGKGRQVRQVRQADKSDKSDQTGSNAARPRPGAPGRPPAPAPATPHAPRASRCRRCGGASPSGSSPPGSRPPCSPPSTKPT